MYIVLLQKIIQQYNCLEKKHLTRNGSCNETMGKSTKKIASNKQSLIEIHLDMQMDTFLMFNI